MTILTLKRGGSKKTRLFEPTLACVGTSRSQNTGAEHGLGDAVGAVGGVAGGPVDDRHMDDLQVGGQAAAALLQVAPAAGGDGAGGVVAGRRQWDGLGVQSLQRQWGGRLQEGNVIVGRPALVLLVDDDGLDLGEEAAAVVLQGAVADVQLVGRVAGDAVGGGEDPGGGDDGAA